MEKLSRKEKMSYGLGDFASQLSWQVVSSYLLIFYTDVFGLAPAVISVIMLVARIWDGINDPMMGMIMERTRSRWGRFRPYLLFMAPVMALFNVLTFLAPDIQGNAKIAYALVTYIGLGMAYTALNIPYGGLATVMTQSTEERSEINMWRTIGSFSGAFFVNLMTMRLVTYFGERGGNGYLITALVYSLAAIPMFWICFKNCKERYIPKQTQKVSIKDSLKCIAVNRHLLVLMVYSLFSSIHMSLRLGTLAYYFTYIVGKPTLMATLLPMEILCAIACTPMGVKLSKKIGIKQAAVAGCLLRTAGLAILFFIDPSNLPVLVAATLFTGCTNFMGPLTNTMVATTIDYAEAKTGVRADGTIYATHSLVTKIASAISGALGVMLIASFGYIANAAQTPEAIWGIRFTSQGVPAIMMLISAVILALGYGLDEKKHEEILAKLEIQRQKA